MKRTNCKIKTISPFHCFLNTKSIRIINVTINYTKNKHIINIKEYYILEMI